MGMLTRNSRAVVKAGELLLGWRTSRIRNVGASGNSDPAVSVIGAGLPIKPTRDVSWTRKSLPWKGIQNLGREWSRSQARLSLGSLTKSNEISDLRSQPRNALTALQGMTLAVAFR